MEHLPNVSAGAGEQAGTGQSRRVFLFSGHMVDAKNRPSPRFPNEKSALAEAAIGHALDDLQATKADLSISGAACGGDLLFAELCLARDMAVHLYLPFDEPLFLEKSVRFAGAPWLKKYFRVKAHPHTTMTILAEKFSAGENPYTHTNLRMLRDALAHGADKLRFIALWDQKEGDGPGGTKHMLDTVRQRLGQVSILDTNIIFRE